MEKVMCLNCRDIGYTASPKYARCQCGSRLIVMGKDHLKSMELERFHAQRSILDGHVMVLNDPLNENPLTEVKEYESFAHSS